MVNNNNVKTFLDFCTRYENLQQLDNLATLVAESSVSRVNEESFARAKEDFIENVMDAMRGEYRSYICDIAMQVSDHRDPYKLYE